MFNTQTDIPMFNTQTDKPMFNIQTPCKSMFKYIDI